MKLKTILSAAATAVVLTVAGVSAADAAPYGYHHDVRRDIRDDRRDLRADRRDLREDRRDLRFDRRIIDHRVVFDGLRARHIRYAGEPFFLRGHYVVRSYDRFGHVIFVEFNPYTGGYIGFVRL